ncbi:MAG TPA: hypothetical protein VIK91_08350 [Nannocystis sp.]
MAVITASTGEGSSSTSTGAAPESSTGSVSEDSSTGETGESGSSSAGPLLDVGGGELPVNVPAGCQGKIDFLFVVSRHPLMEEIQAQVLDAAPKFIATIESKFADFDYQIMVVDGDPWWSSPVCDAECGQWCLEAGYPCDALAQLTDCDVTMGAGVVFPAGTGAANAPCDIGGGRRYLTREEPDLAGSFKCLMRLGTSGEDWLGEAVTQAVSPELTGPGGCNEGFLRDDALLMVTFIYNSPDMDSAGKPKLWADAIIKAKHGDLNAIMVFGLGSFCVTHDRVCTLVKNYFPNWYISSNEVPDYGPDFEIATDMMLEVCGGSIPH